ncbi:MAG: acyl carrier protein [Solirubrobacterales bacterium]|jgi:acyl carrier protein
MTETVTREAVQDRVFAALEEFGADPAEISLDAEFEAIDIDSLDIVELAQIVEDEYGVELKGEDVEGIKTVGQAVELVVSRLP